MRRSGEHSRNSEVGDGLVQGALTDFPISNCLQCGKRLNPSRRSKTGLCRDCYWLLQKAQSSYKPEGSISKVG